MKFRPRILAILLMGLLPACADPEAAGITSPEGDLFAAAVDACVLGVTDGEARTLIASLLLEIDGLEASGALNAGQASALRNHLQNVLRHVDAGRYCAALAQLDAFRQQVDEFVDEGILTEEEAASLEEISGTIIEGLPEFPNQVVVDAPSSAAGTYDATGAAFGPTPTAAGVSAGIARVNDGTGGPGTPTDACEPLIGFPAGAIALVDRGQCTFVIKARNAQAAGAVAMIVVQNTAGPPIPMGGADPEVAIPSVMISLADGAVIEAGLPAAGTVRRTP